MSKEIGTATTGGMTEAQVKRERASILRDLDDIERRWAVKTTDQEEADLLDEIRGARLRVIAFARARGGATFARMMRPFDEHTTGDNVVRFCRRVR